jgi:XrtJ-associated TM-motif-TM protein
MKIDRNFFSALLMKVSKMRVLAVLSGLLMVSLTVPPGAYAQLNGCVDSPENPTVVLALIGAAAAAFPLARSYLKSRNQKASRID